MILIVAGVSGSGKTTVGALVAGRLRWRFADADTFHPEANVAKMRSGIPLTDEDRAPWLRAIGEWMDRQVADGQLRRGDLLGAQACLPYELLAGRPTATMVFLLVSREVLERRLVTRPDHFFPEKLLESQLAAFEPPAPDEGIETVLSEGDPGQTAAKVIAAVWPYGEPAA